MNLVLWRLHHGNFDLTGWGYLCFLIAASAVAAIGSKK